MTLLKCMKPENYGSDLSLPVEPIAAERGLEVVVADNYTLMLDLDTPGMVETFNRNLLKLSNELSRRQMSYRYILTKSMSGNTHAYVQLTAPLDGFEGEGKVMLGIWERIALQAALGSDPMRELMNSMREFFHIPREQNVVLFETPAEYIRVLEFLK